MMPPALKEILSVPEFEERARACLPANTYEYLASGAADENTVRWNRDAYDLIKLRPRVLRDVTTVDTSLSLLGQKLESPILLAPTAFLRAIHPDGEIAVARGAGAARTTWVVSTATTTSLEDIAPEATSPLWFQLYVQSDRSVTKDLAQRAEGVGCKALCLTVDTPVQGPRNRQTRSKFALPPGLSAPYMSELVAGRAIADNRRGNVVTWDDVEWLQSVARIPLLIKGILDADDAERAVAAGVNGIIVSNHGGRNLDTAPATIDALPKVAERVAARVPVLVDGGIRRGTDIVKAIAYGATAVLIGRPYCYGLAVAGAEGVTRVIEILKTELEMTLQLIGCRSLSELGKNVLWSGGR
jgi:4-hydroxymandelate oxidase